MIRTQERVLVLGCSDFPGIDSATWQDQVIPNIPDYDLVVVSTPHLTVDFLKTVKGDYLKELRKAFVRFLHSGGKVIVLVSPRIEVNRPKMYPEHVSSSDWCPIAYVTPEEAGKSIMLKHDVYRAYLEKMSEWSFYLAIPRGCLSSELTDFYGSTHNTKYEVPLKSYLENRYGRVLAGHFHVEVRHEKKRGNHYGDSWSEYSKEPDITTGTVVLLPLIGKASPEEALASILQEEIGWSLKSPEPDWATSIEMPGVPELVFQIEEASSRVSRETQIVQELEAQVLNIQSFRRLLYATGGELEAIVKRALEELGGEVLPSKYSQEEYILEFEGKEFLIEVKGVTKSIALSHIRQLNDYLLKYQEDTGKECKGILFGNAWRNTPPDMRGLEETQVFPDNVVKRAEQWGISLVSSTAFFGAFVQALRSPKSSNSLLTKMTTCSGVATFE